MKVLVVILLVAAAAVPTPAEAGEIRGPGRFCGYSSIIDLLPGEKITTLGGGIHSGRFRWEGEFGSLEVLGIGWASRPKGRIVRGLSSTKPARFSQRRVNGAYEVAIWNGAQGAAYFRSEEPISALQLQAIDRVSLFQEGQEPTGCDLRTVFVWE
jgi:hypothetical protein